MKHGWIVMASVLLVIAACSTAKPTEKAAAEAPEASAERSAANEAAAVLQQLANSAVYFDFDQSVVKPDYQDRIRAGADLMSKHKGLVVTLEGSADERGTVEYNLALGTRRAEAVRDALIAMGVPSDQIRVVSMGEEHPRATCHAEECWKENRRVDFVGQQGS